MMMMMMLVLRLRLVLMFMSLSMFPSTADLFWYSADVAAYL